MKPQINYALRSRGRGRASSLSYSMTYPEAILETTRIQAANAVPKSANPAVLDISPPLNKAAPIPIDPIGTLMTRRIGAFGDPRKRRGR